jgi:hypothetical protein
MMTRHTRLTLTTAGTAILVVGTAFVASAQQLPPQQPPLQQQPPQQQTAPPPQSPFEVRTPRALVEGAWTLNVAASTATGSLTAAPGGQAAGRSSGGRRGGRGGGGYGGGGMGGTPAQDSKTRALVQDITTAPKGLTLVLGTSMVTLTSDTGESMNYMISDKQESHTLTNGTIKTTTAWDGSVVTQHIDAGNGLKFLRTYAVSGDQLIVTITRDTGNTSTASNGTQTSPAAEVRSVYDPARDRA